MTWTIFNDVQKNNNNDNGLFLNNSLPGSWADKLSIKAAWQARKVVWPALRFSPVPLATGCYPSLSRSRGFKNITRFNRAARELNPAP